MRSRVGIAGAGAWGTALAVAAARAGRDVALWGRNADVMTGLAATRRAAALAGVLLDDAITPTADPACIAGCDIFVAAVPTQAMREVLTALAGKLRPGTPAVIAAKGIERGSSAFVSDIAAQCLPSAPVAVLSGPSFAADVAGGLPTAVTLAQADPDMARTLAAALGSASFRIYHSDDVRGVEIGGAAKNVLAIAAGITVGLGLGESARAAIVTRGFAELRRFAAAYDARPETLMGLSGLGDLLLSAGSAQSRNFAFGLALGRGMPAGQAAGGKLAEGSFTAPVLADKARERGVDMPIVDSVAALLDGRLGVREAMASLMARPQKAEE